MIAVIWGVSGLVILGGVFLPIISYNVFSQKNFPELLSLVITDYTKASHWFPNGVESNGFAVAKVDFYTLTISKLEIEGAVVAMGGEDLAKSLIQYPGTALPGKKGNAVIFGHSILPIFYNPHNYLSIFSKLPILKPGDEIKINYDNVLYRYRVESLFEVKPTDIQVLQQDPSDSFLTLVTCVPPGDPRKPKRLVVRARIIPLES